MDPIKIATIIVHTDEKDSRQLCTLIEELEKFFKNSLPVTLRHITVTYVPIEANVDKLEENIIFTIIDSNTADMILILHLASKRTVITKIINKIADTEHTIGKVFAEIPLFLKTTNSKCLQFACRNNKLIFFISGNYSGILKIVQTSVDTMILATYLLQIVIRQCNILNDSQVEEKENLCPPHITSYLPSALELSVLSDSNNSNNDAKQDITTNQKTCQSNVSVEKALNILSIATITEKVSVSLEKETVHINDAFGRISSQVVTCSNNVPPFLAATKQGYAVVAHKKEGNEIEMKTDESSKINPIILDPDTSIPVDKGDCIPLGANAVIPAKNVINSYDDMGMPINLTTHTIKYLENTRSPGSDIKKNVTIIEAFTHIGSMEMGLLTASGCKEITVYKKLSIGVLTIGNKLQEPGKPLKSEHLYDSNRAILISLLKENFHSIHSLDFGITSEDTALIVRNISAALEKVDVLVTTGCSSDKDCLKSILRTHFKATVHFENVNIKPGKSTAFVSCIFQKKNKIILCLPRNPVSVFLTAHLFLFPLINFIYGNFNKKYPMMQVKLALELKQELPLHSRPRYVWATLSWDFIIGCNRDTKPRAKITNKNQNSISNKLSDIENANAILILPSKTPEKSMIKNNASVPAMLIKFSNF